MNDGHTESRSGQRRTRREFLTALGGSLAVLGAGRTGDFLAPRAERLTRIGVQLYTVRREMQRDVAATLARVARIGYREVEFAGYFGRRPNDIRALLDAHGLVSPSAHSADMATIRTRWSQALEDAHVMGQQYLVCASLPRSDTATGDDWKRTAAFFNQAGEQALRAGIHLGYHNHNAEFAPLGSGDTSGYDILLDETDPRYVKQQMDLYWIVKAGKDPLAYFAKYPGRYFSVHVKDMAASGDMADAGAGQLPFPTYFVAARKAGVTHHFVEHDQPADAFASITASYAYLAKLEF